MKTKLITLVGIIAALFAGCKGDTGAPGPQGPAGVANITSGEITSNISDWSEFNNNTAIWTASYSDNAITDQDNDLVEAFVQGAQGWYSMPVSNFLVTPDQLAFSYSNGSITFFYDNTASDAPPQVALTFKVVVIPPAVAKKYPNANWKDYNTVNSLLQLQTISAK